MTNDCMGEGASTDENVVGGDAINVGSVSGCSGVVGVGDFAEGEFAAITGEAGSGGRFCSN